MASKKYVIRANVLGGVYSQFNPLLKLDGLVCDSRGRACYEIFRELGPVIDSKDGCEMLAKPQASPCDLAVNDDGRFVKHPIVFRVGSVTNARHLAKECCLECPDEAEDGETKTIPLIDFLHRGEYDPSDFLLAPGVSKASFKRAVSDWKREVDYLGDCEDYIHANGYAISEGVSVYVEEVME